MSFEGKKRCFGSMKGQELYAEYHDNEWGIAVRDDQKLFEMLILEGAQAGLNWFTILKKRDGYRAAFYNFDAVRVASMPDTELENLMHNPGIIQNRLKIYSARSNAQIFCTIVHEFGSFNNYLWSFVNNKVIKNAPLLLSDIPTTSVQSDALSQDLKKRGMKFVGSKIIYSYMQAVGMIQDHIIACWRYQE